MGEWRGMQSCISCILTKGSAPLSHYMSLQSIRASICSLSPCHPSVRTPAWLTHTPFPCRQPLALLQISTPFPLSLTPCTHEHYCSSVVLWKIVVSYYLQWFMEPCDSLAGCMICVFSCYHFLTDFSETYNLLMSWGTQGVTSQVYPTKGCWNTLNVTMNNIC